jgi:hypothetical protein
MLTLLTATGGRPEALDLCFRWMNNQDYKGEVRWVIVDDVSLNTAYRDKIRKDWDVTVALPSPKWEEGQNTQARNLLAGLLEVDPNSKLLIIEDDDYYHRLHDC